MQIIFIIFKKSTSSQVLLTLYDGEEEGEKDEPAVGTAVPVPDGSNMGLLIELVGSTLGTFEGAVEGLTVGSPALYVGAGVLVGDVGMTEGKELGVVAVGHADGE